MSEYFTSMTLDYDKILRDLEDCDIVEFNRLGYSHYAFHIGNGILVHVTGSHGGSSAACIKKGVKCAQHLREVADNKPCRINNLEAAKFFQQVGSFGTAVGTRSKSEAKRLALEGLKVDSSGKPLLGIEHGITVTYDLMGCNCERYCTYWKYDHALDGFSQQAYNGAFNTTLGNAQRALDAAAAGYFELATSDKVNPVVRPLCAVAGAAEKVGAVTVGTTKAVMDGATSVAVGAITGITRLFK